MVDESKLSDFSFNRTKTVKMTVSDDHNQMLSKLFNPEFMKSDLHKRKLPPSFFKQPSEDRRASINPEGLKIQNEVSIFHNKSNSSPACINPEFYDRTNLLHSDSLESELKPSINQISAPVHVKSESYDTSDKRLLSGALNKNRFEICPLGPSYDMDINSAGQVYFLNHDSQETTWFDPRIPVEYQRWGMSVHDLEDAHKAYANALQSKSCDDVMTTPSSMKPIQQLQFHGRSFSQPVSSAQSRGQPCTPQSHMRPSQLPSGQNVTVPTCSSHAFSSMESNTAATALLSSPGSGIPSPVGCFTSVPPVSPYKMTLSQQQCLVVYENNSTRSHPPTVYTRSNTVPGIIANISHNQPSSAKHKENHSHYHHVHHPHHPHHFHHQSAPVPSPTSTRGIGQRSRVMPVGGYPTSPTNLPTVSPHPSQKPQHTMSSSTSSMNQSLPLVPATPLGSGAMPYPGYPINLVSPPSHSHQSSLDSGRGSGKCSSQYGAPEFQSFQSVNKPGTCPAPANNNLVGLSKVGASGAPMPHLSVSTTPSQQPPLSQSALSSGLKLLPTGATDVVMVEQQYAFTDGSLMNSSNLDAIMSIEPMDYSMSMDDLPDISDLDFDLTIGSPSGPMHVQ